MKSSRRSVCTRVRKVFPATIAVLLAAAMIGSAEAQQSPQVQQSPSAVGPRPPASSSANDALQEIVVTGTQIHGVDAPVGSALVTVSQDDIQNTGLQTTADVIRSLPFVSQIGPGESVSNSAQNTANLNTTKAQGINIRGLGDQATLSLFDGRRVVPAGEGAQFWDPSAIPAIAVQRIEVVPDGASAIYGADAVAGVVNLVLRKNFDGAEVEASDGWARDFANQAHVSGIFGHRWDTGSIMIAGELFRHPQLLASDRASLYQDNQTPYGGSDLRNLFGAPGNITYNGTLYGLPPGSGSGVTPAQFSNTVNKTTQWADTSILPSNERHSAVINVQQQLSDRVNVWLEGYYTRRYGTLENQILSETGMQVPSTNPFFIPGAAAACSSGSGLCDSVNYSFGGDLGAEVTHFSETSHQLAIGMDVDLGHDFKLGVYGTNNENSEVDLFTGINGSALAAALADSDPSTALNVMGSGGNNNPATLRRILGYNNFTSNYHMNALEAKVDGPVAELPGGAVRVAIGTEWHKDILHNFNYGNTSTVNVETIVPSVNTTAERTVSSGYVEAIVPFFGKENAIAGIQRLELDLAGRYDRYSDVGSTSNPKIGLRWDPTADITAHASFGRSFRAPTLCDTNPDCTAGVITIPYPDLGWRKNNPASIFGPGVSLTSIEVGGFSGLKPETAKTYSLGMDWHPSWVHSLNVSLDFYRIDYKNIIDTPAAFNPAAGSNPAFAPFVIRNPTLVEVEALFASAVAGFQSFPASLVNLIVDGRRHNVGEALTNGMDFSIKKDWESPVGTWTTGVSGTYVFNYEYSLVPGDSLIDVLNTVQGSGAAYPLRLTARGQLGWRRGGFNAMSFINFHNAYTNTAPPTGTTEGIAPYTTVDLNIGYDTGESAPEHWLKNASVSLSTINLFNRMPPFALIGTQSFDSTTGSPLGRLVTVQVHKKF